MLASTPLKSKPYTLHRTSSTQHSILEFYIFVEWKNVCFGTISSSKEKGPTAIWIHLLPILDLVKASCPNVTVVHFFSDGPCTQYRQKGNFYLFCTKLHQCWFQSGTWNFFEASHGYSKWRWRPPQKGAPNGAGGLLKRTADRLVSHRKDIPNAELFFNILVDAQISVKLFYISEDSVDEATKNMPDSLPVVPSTMHIHKVVRVTPRQVSYRDVSCLCSIRQTMECQCYNTKTFTFEVQATAPTQEDNSQKQSKIPWQKSDIIGQWCSLKYDNVIYLGIIQEMTETHIEVKCMHQIGVNRFFWPRRDDVLWYLQDDIIRMIPPPTSVTSRHVEIDRDIWSEISEM